MVTADAVVSKLSSRLCTTDAAIPQQFEKNLSENEKSASERFLQEIFFRACMLREFGKLSDFR